MGQRLNIEIVHDGECVANAYYHWSAFTTSSIDLAIKVLSAIDNVNENDIRLKAIRILESTGAGLTKEELLLLPSEMIDVSYSPCIDRNEGLISISEKGIEDTRCWEEGRVTIDIDSKTADFQVVFQIDKDDYEDYEIIYDELPTYEFDFSIDNMTIENLVEFMNFIKSVEQGSGYFKMYDNVYCSVY